MKSNCFICNRIDQIKKGKNPYFVTELETGYLVIGDPQFFKGYTLLLCKQHVPELHQLEKSFRLKFLEEMSLVSEAVWNWVKPKVLNYEALGNSVPHLHWHIFPRHEGDPNPEGPIWKLSKDKRNAEQYCPGPEQLRLYRGELFEKIKDLTSRE